MIKTTEIIPISYHNKRWNNYYAYNTISLFYNKSEIIETIKCANYITPNICKFTGKPCDAIKKGFEFYSGFLLSPNRSLLLLDIPHFCPLINNRKSHKNFLLEVTSSTKKNN